MIRRCAGCGMTEEWTIEELWEHYEKEHQLLYNIVDPDKISK